MEAMSVTLEFLSSLLEGVRLIALAVSVGGICYMRLLLCSTEDLPAEVRIAFQQAPKTVAYAAGAIAVIQVLQLILKSSALIDQITPSALLAFIHTRLFQAAVIRIGLAIGLAMAAHKWLDRHLSPPRWGVMVLLGLLLLWVEGWFSHAASRLEDSLL